jgi:hypothetical protein
MLSDRQKQQLQGLNDIYEISRSCSTNSYIWGGLVMDIFEGCFLREHRDIDCFTLNLLDVKSDMNVLFQQKGYSTKFLSDIDMLQIERDGCHAAFNRLEIDNDAAMWRHIGNEGTFCFPRVWLENRTRYFYDTPVLVSGIEFEYSIKTKVKLLSPIWELRENDLKALEYWNKKIRDQNINPENLLTQIWSDNPYWRKKGHKE